MEEDRQEGRRKLFCEALRLGEDREVASGRVVEAKASEKDAMETSDAKQPWL